MARVKDRRHCRARSADSQEAMKVGEVSIRGRDQGTGPAHHMVSGETDVPPGEADVIAEMTGGMENLQRGIAFDDRCRHADHSDPA